MFPVYWKDWPNPNPNFLGNGLWWAQNGLAPARGITTQSMTCDWGWIWREPAPFRLEIVGSVTGSGRAPWEATLTVLQARASASAPVHRGSVQTEFPTHPVFFLPERFENNIFLKCGLWINSSLLTWKLDQKADSWAPPPSSWMRQILWGSGLRSGLQKVLLVFLTIEATVLDHIGFFFSKRKENKNQKNKLHSIL